MSNYYINQKNELINNSEKILEYLTGMYMDQYHGALLALSGDSYPLSALTYRQIISYRRVENDGDTQKRVHAAMRKWLGRLFTADCGLGYIINSTGTSVQITLAAESTRGRDSIHALEADVPQFNTAEVRDASLPWQRHSAWGGILLNIPPLEVEYIDHVLDNLTGHPGNVGLFAFPSTRTESYLSGLFDLKAQAESLSNFSTTYGNGSHRSIKMAFPALTKLGDYLDKQIARWSQARGMWEGCVWFSAGTEEDADRLGEILAGAFSPQGRSADAPCIYALTDRNPFQTGMFEIPDSEYSRPDCHIPYGLKKSPLDSFFTFDDMVAMLQLPAYSHPGIEVLATGGATSPLRPFDIGGDTSGEIHLGRVSDSTGEFCLRLNDLTEHVLVTGATGSGKTNTVMKIVEGAGQAGIPYCIIEPSKKDYWVLAHRYEGLAVYSAGQDAFPLKINPFVPEYGVDIAAHISSLMYAFSGAFDMEAPTRFALEGLLKFSYKRAGWDLAEIYHRQNKPLPQIHDLIAHLPKFMAQELQYGQEVSDNITGAIQNRLKSMNEGIISRIVACPIEESLTGEYLCSNNTLLELDDLPMDVKPFITGLVLMKIGQHLRRQNPARRLRNIIVLEEAHNVFSEITPQRPQTSRSIASEYFSNMLSEIREYGTGLIIADQGASKINSNAISNTKVKILHSVSSRTDAEAEAYAMHLDDRRMSYLPEFRTGEALIAVRGMPQVWKVAVGSVPRQAPKNIACLLCRHRRMCSFDDISRMIPLTDFTLESVVRSAIVNSYDMTTWASLISWVQRQYGLDGHDRTCLLGYLLDNFASTCGAREKRRILYLFYSIGGSYAHT